MYWLNDLTKLHITKTYKGEPTKLDIKNNSNQYKNSISVTRLKLSIYLTSEDEI